MGSLTIVWIGLRPIRLNASASSAGILARYHVAGFTSLLDPPSSSSISTELLFPFPLDFLALIVTSGDSTGLPESQLPGRLACILFGLFFNVDGRDLGLDGLDLVGEFDFKGEGLRATGDFLADKGTGVGDGEGRNGILTREWLEAIRIAKSCRGCRSVIVRNDKLTRLVPCILFGLTRGEDTGESMIGMFTKEG